MRKEKGITLIALVITIIVLIILAGVSISLVLGENGILTRAKAGKEEYSKADAREKLELVLLDFQAKRASGEQYEETELNKALQEKDMEVEENLVIVEGWQFIIDRSVPKIVEELERLSEQDLKKASIKKIETIVGETSVQVTIKLRNEEGATIVYKINEIKENGEKETVQITESIEELTYTFENLKSSQKYEIEVETNNEFGTSSKKVEIETKEPILITKITLEKTEEKVGLNHTKTLKYKIEPENATNKNLKWELSDNEIATVENGEITGIKIGNCTITATAQDSGKVSTTCTIKIVNGISTVAELESINPSGDYIIINDIVIGESEFTTINSFSGTLDGQGYSIKNLNNPLINSASNATIENLKLENVSINKGNDCYAAVCKLAHGSMTFKNICVTGSISGTWNIASIFNSEGDGEFKVENCYSFAQIKNGGYGSAGLACNADPHSNWGVVHMKDCYFSGELIAGSWQHSPTSYGYDKVGISQGCYYNSDCYGQEYSNSNVTALTTAQFADKNNFGNWDFENTWIMKDGHPELRIFIDKK